MKQTIINKSDRSDIHIEPLKANISQITHAMFLIVWVELTDGRKLLSSVVESAKKKITQYLLNEADPYKSYQAICATLLNKRFQCKEKYDVSACCFISQISDLLVLTPATDKTTNLKSKALAEAVLSIIEEPSDDNDNYWKGWFRESNSHIELCLFCDIVHFQTKL